MIYNINPQTKKNETYWMRVSITHKHTKMSSEQIEKTISKLVSYCCHAKLWKEKCNCEEIKTIQKHIRIWIKNINKLEPILFNNFDILVILLI